MNITTSCPSFASALGSEPQTSPRPPVLAMGETSALTKRMRTVGSLYQWGADDLSVAQTLLSARAGRIACATLSDQNRRVSHHVAIVAVDVARGGVFDQTRAGRAQLGRGDE